VVGLLVIAVLIGIGEVLCLRILDEVAEVDESIQLDEA
jgi:hypothetical protein